MNIRFYNSLSRSVEDFEPIRPGQVSIYSCGPTVYDFAHIGNFRSFLFGDVLRRFLDRAGFDVAHVMNITDVGHMTDADNADGGGEDRMKVGSRRLKEAKKKGVEFIELPVAYDGLTVVVNKANYWVDNLTVDELRQIFLERHAAKTWKDVRSDWPDLPISIYAPGTDSGTFDYFKEVVAGDEGSIRSDMSVSEDDNVLVRGVSGEAGAIGFFGVAYYDENRNKLKAVPIVNPDTGKPVSPTAKAIEEGDYAPFSRPLFIYVSKKSAQRPEVRAFVEFYLTEGPELVEDVGYVKLPKWVMTRAMEYFEKGKTGTHFVKDGEKVSMPITRAMKK